MSTNPLNIHVWGAHPRLGVVARGRYADDVHRHAARSEAERSLGLAARDQRIADHARFAERCSHELRDWPTAERRRPSATDMRAAYVVLPARAQYYAGMPVNPSSATADAQPPSNVGGRGSSCSRGATTTPILSCS